MDGYFLIHGAGASPLSLATLRRNLEGSRTVCFSYDATDPFSSILDRCVAELRASRCDVVVGHSFGGVLAWHAGQEVGHVLSGCSVATPWGGFIYADVIDWLTLGGLPNQFFSNISRFGPHLVRPRTSPSRTPWLNVVTTRGAINRFPPNDGVVTVSSQRSIHQGSTLSTVEIDESHSEVLQTDELAQLLLRAGR